MRGTTTAGMIDIIYLTFSAANKRLEANSAPGQKGIDHIVQLPHITFGIRVGQEGRSGTNTTMICLGDGPGTPSFACIQSEVTKRKYWVSNPNFSPNLRFP